MNTLQFISFVFLLNLSLGSQPAFAQETTPPEPTEETTEAEVANDDSTSTGSKKKFYSQLNLTKEQKQKIIEIKKKSMATIKDSKEAVMAARAAYHEAFDSISEDTELESKFRALQTARQTLADSRFQQMILIRAVLNDEQKKKFHELKAQFRK